MEMTMAYKQTEVGVIPEDWEVKSVGSLLRRGRLGGNYPNQDVETPFPLMKMGNIDRGYIDTRKIQYIASGVSPDTSDRLQNGDLLFNTRNTLDLVGKVAIWRDELPIAYYNSNLMRLDFDVDQICSNAYANYAFNSHAIVTRLRAIATGTTSVAAIYTRDLLQLPFPVPPKKEQIAIAEALSDADGLIRGLEKLITKKRDLKQAAMQQLLTGKRRLPGFSAEWEVKSLREGVKLLSGHHVLAQHCNTDGLGFPYITGPSDFPRGVIQHSKFTERPSTICRVSDILVTVKGSGVGTMVLSNGEYCISRQLMAIRVTDWNTAFIYYSLLQDSSVLGAAATGLIPGLSRDDILNKQMAMPSLPEQAAIAAVLSDVDAEIGTLETRRDKTKALERGIMQELLTGKLRLV